MAPTRRLKIGEKTTAGDKVVEKRFTNGHKTFNASEAKAFHETLRAEKFSATIFDSKKHEMIRPRNPLTGELTPRDEGTETKSERRGNPLIPLNQTETKFRQQVQVTSKIGVPIDLLEMSEGPKFRISSLRCLQDNITGELDFLKSKINAKEEKVKANIRRNKELYLTSITKTKLSDEQRHEHSLRWGI